MLKTGKKVENGTLTFALSGWLDTTTAPQFEQEIKASLDGVTEIVLDMKELEYISSAGLRVLLSVQKIMNARGSMKVVNVQDGVMEIFEITGFSDILNIE